MKRKIIVTCAFTGNFLTKSANVNLPEQPSEIASAAYDAYCAGASIAHIHARDLQGTPINDSKIYSEIGSQIKSKCNMLLQYSTVPTFNGKTTAEDGVGILYDDDLFKPEMCSLNCSLISTIYKSHNILFEWTREFIIKNLLRMNKLNIKPDLEIFNLTSAEDILNNILPQGILNDPLSLSFMMGLDKGCHQAMPYNIDNLYYLIKKIPKNTLFNVVAGDENYSSSILGLLLGGNIRVGFEDSEIISNKKANSNAYLVEKIVKIIEDLGYDVATPMEAREILGLVSKSF